MYLSGQGSHMSFLCFPIRAGRWFRKTSCLTLATNTEVEFRGVRLSDQGGG